MRAIALSFIGLLTACASSVQDAHKISTPHGSSMSTNAYNNEIRSQVVQHYCDGESRFTPLEI